MNSRHYAFRGVIALLSLIVLVVVGVTTVAASSASSTASASSAALQQGEILHRRLSPTIQPFGFFDPGYKYLDRGDVSVEDLGNQKLKITVTTEAKSSVESIGASVQLQKWTGSVWANVGNSSTKDESDTWYYQNTFQMSVESGYYYRVKTTHWVTHGITHESGETVTSTILTQ